MNTKNLSVIGLGKLGSPMAAVFAQKGYNVIGLDINPAFVDQINSGIAPVNEPQLQECINASNGRLRATTDYQEAIINTDVTFVILPTPSQTDGFFSNDLLVEAAHEIGSALKQKNRYHLVVITSTTMPGSTGGILKETLEQASGKQVGQTLGLCYSPEFIALGSVIHDMLHPDFVLIGESDKTAGDILQAIYLNCCNNTPIIKRMSFANAELTKISVNTFVTTKISYANMVAEFCDHIDETDAEVVLDAVGSDSRIGQKYLKGAIGYGGPCFPRDNKAFSALGKAIGSQYELAEATDKINDYQVIRLVKKVIQLTPAKSGVAILGLAYKPDTEIIEESQAVLVAGKLADSGYQVRLFDPKAKLSPSALEQKNRLQTASLAEAIQSVSTIVLTTPWPEFKHIDFALYCGDRELTVIDPWRIVDPDTIAANIHLVLLGKGGG